MHRFESSSFAAAIVASLLVQPVVTQASDRAKGDAALSTKGKQFMMKAAQAGHAEVETGKLAATNAGSDDVKKFAQRMV